MSRFRVKLVLPAVRDTQMFYPASREEADAMMACFRRDVLSQAEGDVFLYIETPYGHVRIA